MTRLARIEKSGIGFRRTLRSRVEQEFGDISKASHFPFHVGGVLELRRVMCGRRTHGRILLRLDPFHPDAMASQAKRVPAQPVSNGAFISGSDRL